MIGTNKILTKLLLFSGRGHGAGGGPGQSHPGSETVLAGTGLLFEYQEERAPALDLRIFHISRGRISQDYFLLAFYI